MHICHIAFFFFLKEASEHASLNGPENFGYDYSIVKKPDDVKRYLLCVHSSVAFCNSNILLSKNDEINCIRLCLVAHLLVMLYIVVLCSCNYIQVFETAKVTLTINILTSALTSFVVNE